MLIFLLLLIAMPAAADPASDYRSIHHDWEKDGKISQCYWTREQLENAREESKSNPDDYYNDFPAQVDAEIVRQERGRCEPRPRIASVSGSREEVVIVNRGGKGANLAGLRLRDRHLNTIKLRSVTLDPGEKLIVRSGRRRVWDDKGDIARLVDGRGKVISQYGFGRFRKTKRF